MSKEEEFLSSLMALCVRYDVTIEKTIKKNKNNEVETTYFFDDSLENGDTDIYLDIEYVADVIKGKLLYE